MKDLRKQFEALDDNGSGSLNVQEFRSLLSEGAIGLPDGVAEVMMDMLDTDHNGQINFKEFLSMMHLASQQERIVIEDDLDPILEMEIMMQFWEHDTEGDNSISIQDISDLIEKADIARTSKKLLVAMADANGDGIIDLEEFRSIYLRLCNRLKFD